MKNKVLIILSSFHHKNTEKIAKVIADALYAEIKTPEEVNVNEIEKYDLIGFGSGIYDGHHHNSQINIVDKLPISNKKVFIFSTTGAPKFIVNAEFIKGNHSLIKEKLESRGYEVIGEFGCRGWNTNSFLKYFGGLNKDRPNSEDLNNAMLFANSLIDKM